MYTEENLADLYNEARNGLFHNGMVKGKIIINNSFDQAIIFEDITTIKINPLKLLRDIFNDFDNYLNELKIPGTLRDNFDSMYSNI